MNDAQLLQEFAARGSEQAFRQLMDRHLPLVLGTARRLTSDSALAEEIAQTVFVLLARKAPKLSSEVVLSGWLYGTTRFVSNRALVSEHRRKHREQEAAIMTNETDPDPIWKEIAPQLDDALGRLRETDRSALLLRFFEQCSMRDVGVALGLTEEAAKKRVNRALEKLRGIVKRRGFEIPAAALAAGLAREQAKAGVTPALSAAISSAALSQLALGTGGAAAGTGLVTEVLAAWRWAKVKTALVGTAAVVGLSLLVPIALEQLRETPASNESENQFVQAGEPEGAPLTAENSSDPLATLTDLPAREVTVTVLDAATGEPIPNTRLKSTMSITIDGLNNAGETVTDERGMGRLLVPDSMHEFQLLTHLGIFVQAEDYAPRKISWLHPAGDVLSFVSSEYTVRLERGLTLAGTVVDEQGRPLRGIRVGVSGSNYGGYSISYEEGGKRVYHPEFLEGDFASISVSADTSAAEVILTDSKGRFVVKNFPGDLRAVNFELLAENGARRKFRTPATRSTAESIPKISFEELKAGTARLVFSTGLTVEGIVLDADGFPVPLAEVAEGTQWGNLKIEARTHTDHDGKFRLTDRKAREVILAASAPGHGSASTIVFVEPGMDEIRLQLPRQIPLRGQVVAETGEPLAGARVSAPDILNEGLGLEFEARTDSSGRFVWRSAPTNQVAIMAMAPDLRVSKAVKLRAGPEEHIITLRADAEGKILITGTVVDSETLLPLDEFIVRIKGEKIQGSNGRFEKELSMEDFPPGEEPAWRAAITAQGYGEIESGKYYFFEGDQALELQVSRGGTLEGIVWTPNGEPAPQAEIAFSPPGRAVLSFRPARFEGGTDGKINSGMDGRFNLRKLTGSRGIVAVHESGFAVVNLELLAEPADVQLQLWGRIEGAAMSGGQPLVGTEINLSSIGLSGVAGWAEELLQISYSATTDVRGAFVFDQVPEGAFIASVQPKEWRRVGEPPVKALEQLISIRAGETKNIRLASEGAAVSARLSPPSRDRIEPGNLLAILKRDVAPPTQPARTDYVRESSWREARRRFSRSPHTMAALAQARGFIGETGEEGEVFFRDVPPGRYILEASFFAPRDKFFQGSADPNAPYIQSSKSHILRAAVSVPEAGADDSLFLGDFTMEALK